MVSDVAENVKKIRRKVGGNEIDNIRILNVIE